MTEQQQIEEELNDDAQQRATEEARREAQYRSDCAYRERQTDATIAGSNAAEAGLWLGENPHAEGTELHGFWANGWHAMENLISQATGD